MNNTALTTIPIIDTDTHVVEPPDLWTSRVTVKFGVRIPLVESDDPAQEEAWFSGNQRLGAVGAPAMAGWHEHPPFHPCRFADTDPKSRDPAARTALMDEYGVRSQVLYPNVAVFDARSIVEMNDTELQLGCIHGAQRLPRRFRRRAAEAIHSRHRPTVLGPRRHARRDRPLRVAGHKGIVFTQDPSYFGLPALTDRHWDPMWASAQDKGLAINFHIASGDLDLFSVGHPDNGIHANYTAIGVSFFPANARTIAQLVPGGICHRLPQLNFVTVESGIGWIPFALEALDWQWRNFGVHKEHPEYDRLPSEYFRRQIYGSSWFERDSALSAIEQLGTDNILYETDNPHPTSMSPGPASDAQRPDTTCATCSAPSTSRRCARSSTTTPPASTTSPTDQPAGPNQRTQPSQRSEEP